MVRHTEADDEPNTTAAVYARECLFAAADHVDAKDWPNHRQAFHAAMSYNQENLADTDRDFESVQSIVDDVVTDVFHVEDIPMSERTDVLRRRADELIA